MKVHMVSQEALIDFEDTCNKIAAKGYFPYGKYELIMQPAMRFIQQWIKPETEQEQKILEQRMIHV